MYDRCIFLIIWTVLFLFLVCITKYHYKICHEQHLQILLFLSDLVHIPTSGVKKKDYCFLKRMLKVNVYKFE